MIVQIWYRGVSKHVDNSQTYINTEDGLVSSEKSYGSVGRSMSSVNRIFKNIYFTF